MRFLLPAMFLAVMLGSARAALPPAEVAYVIITGNELAPAFEPLAAFKARLGLATRVVTLDWIAANVAAGADQPATIRGFLQEAYAQWGTRYVLLGGTVDVVPTRWVISTFYPTNGTTRIAADLYYAGLDGNWDGDGDGIYGEPYLNAADPGDAADLQPELAFGRAPVATVEEASLFVRKNLDFQIQNGPSAPGRALLEADVIFPSNWPEAGYIILDGATHAEVVRSVLQAATPAWQTVRYYENRSPYPGALAATAPAFMAAINGGTFRLVHQFAPSFRDTIWVGSDLVTGTQLGQLANQVPFFHVVAGSGCAAHDTPSVLLRTLLAPDGGAAGGIGFTRAAFPSQLTRYLEEFHRQATATPGATVGDALATTMTAFIAGTENNYTGRWTHLTIALLGDPTAPLLPIDMSVANEDDDGDDDQEPPVISRPQTLLTAAPNPFNPQVEIRAELPAAASARLSVCDMRGRVVRDLFSGVLAAGESRWWWDGCDAKGRAAASGVYLLRLETDRRLVQRSVTLAR